MAKKWRPKASKVLVIEVMGRGDRGDGKRPAEGYILKIVLMEFDDIVGVRW